MRAAWGSCGRSSMLAIWWESCVTADRSSATSDSARVSPSSCRARRAISSPSLPARAAAVVETVFESVSMRWERTSTSEAMPSTLRSLAPFERSVESVAIAFRSSATSEPGPV